MKTFLRVRRVPIAMRAGIVSATLSVKSADPIQELIEANKNQQAQTQAALAAIMAIAGILFFREAPSWQRIVGVVFAIVGLFLLRK